MERDKKRQGSEAKEANVNRQKDKGTGRTGDQEQEQKDPFDEADNAKAE